MKNTIILLIVVILLGIGTYFWDRSSSVDMEASQGEEITKEIDMNTDENSVIKETAKEEVKEDVKIVKTNDKEEILGQSTEGRDITAYHFGTGDTELLFVGGIHGGYSWNTALVAYEMVDYLESNPTVIPEDIKVTIIPVLNPDGLYRVTGTDSRFTASQVSSSLETQIEGRFNGDSVDINRNFDCDWQSSAVWKKTTVSGGTKAFSEPESQAVKNYVDGHNLSGVVVWYSSAGGVYASNCHSDVLPETTNITNIFANASGYPAHETFDFYAITGDMVNWLAKENIPAISVLLTNHEDIEWSKNKAGIIALFNHYSK